MDHCRTLQQYSRFVSKMRKRISRATGPLTGSELRDLLQECIDEGILVDFLKQYGTEVISMLFTEMTEEEARDLAREDGYEAGLKKGHSEGRKAEKEMIARNLKASGMDPEEIMKMTGLTEEDVSAL